ncbi:hypothetical protein [Pseudomonas phage vB_Pae_SG_WM_Sew_P27]|nr:MAG TPA_asm: chemotaxis protein [Caudoviricetes sp.]
MSLDMPNMDGIIAVHRGNPVDNLCKPEEAP